MVDEQQRRRRVTNTGSGRNRKRCWCWRCWWLSSLLTLLIPLVQSRADAVETTTLSGVSAAASLTLEITEIGSPMSMETLTGVSADQCKPWDGGTLTWFYESRLLIVSVSNVYEVRDFAVIPNNSNEELRYTPTQLLVRSVEIDDPEGLGFHLSFNATPICGSVKLPTKILCNDGQVVSVNKTVPSSSSARSFCGGRYLVDYRHSYGCTDDRHQPPSCKTACRPTDNDTHCYTCDERDGERRCCPGSAEPECKRVSHGQPIVSPSETWTSDLSRDALIIIIVLASVAAILLLGCVLTTRVLCLEKNKIRRLECDKLRNGFARKVESHFQKSINDSLPTVVTTVPSSSNVSEHRTISNGHYRVSVDGVGGGSTSSDGTFETNQTTPKREKEPIFTDYRSVLPRASSCEPVVGAFRAQKQTNDDLYNRRANVYTPQILSSENVLQPGHSIYSSFERRRHLGTLF